MKHKAAFKHPEKEVLPHAVTLLGVSPIFHGLAQGVSRQLVAAGSSHARTHRCYKSHKDPGKKVKRKGIQAWKRKYGNQEFCQAHFQKSSTTKNKILTTHCARRQRHAQIPQTQVAFRLLTQLLYIQQEKKNLS